MADPATTTTLAFVDVNGALRGKAYSAAAFRAVLSAGRTPLTNLLLAVDPRDEPITDFSEIGLRSGSGDLMIAPLPDGERPLPWTQGASLCLADLHWADGSRCGLSSRQLVVRAAERLAAMSLRAVVAFEYEFRLRSAADGAPVTSAQSYSVDGAERLAAFRRRLVEACGEMGIQIDGIHTEAGPGLVELNVAPDDAVRAADNAIFLRHAVREVAKALGMSASFLAKPVAGEEGSSGHIHLSLWDGDDNALLGDPPTAVGPRLRFATGGLLEHMPAASLLMNPTINSYKRLVPDFFAPVNRSWGTDNRTAAVRAIVDGPRTRLEVRRPGADANPYLALAAILVSAADGLDRELEPAEPIAGDAANLPAADAPSLPGSLESALAAFAADPAFREQLGEEFSRYFETTRRWELRAWQRAVTAWELDRYDLIA
ncbi:MAG TPA: glutamine synthetase family protein [Solirubrobacterales bacterium]|nr:glutamine synthetase family protein [Solirubrobacterales bacterium]